MDKISTLTIDTNVVNARQQIPEMNLLEDWHSKSLIKIFKNDAMDTEMMRGEQSYIQGLEKSKDYTEDMGVGVYGQSRYGHCVYGGSEEPKIFQRIQKILFPSKERKELLDNEIKDIMHLRTHLAHKRDYFITNDGHMIDKKDILENTLAIKVRKPKEIVNELSALFGS